MTKSVHVYPASFAFQTRLIKETKSIVDLGLVDQVEIVGFRDGYNELSYVSDKIVFRGIKNFFPYTNQISLKFINYVHFILKTFFIYRRMKIEFMSCHSLLVLPIGILLKKLGNTSYLIYEPHELETERVGLVGIPRKLTRVLERVLIKYIDTLIVVSQPIGDWYIEKYGLEKVFVVQNMPYINKTSGLKSNLLKEKFKIPNDNLLFIYQGLIAKGRGTESILDVFKRLSPNKHIVFMGYGPYEMEVKKAASRYSNIHFMPAVSIDKIVEYTSSADIGLNFISGEICMSYRYSLPNKFGEYILAGLPVLVSSSLEYLSHLVTQYNCGWSIKSDNPDLLLTFIENVSLEEIERMKHGVTEYARSAGWEFEEKKFNEIYNHK